jgi:catechol 2,3-dioxygenase-like lactoylglutathione lyase family enzyme
MLLVQGFDHFVVPVNDLVAAEEFYEQVLGGTVVKRNGLNVRQRKHGSIPHTFIKLAGKRIGVYLQDDERQPPKGARGTPTYSFTTTRHGLAEVKGALEAWKISCEGPVKNYHSFAAESLFFCDPAGNHFAVYLPHGDGEKDATQSERMTGVGYLELEAPDLGASIKFYEQALGFALLERDADPRVQLARATMQMASGQRLILLETPFSPKGLVMSRTVPGPHLGFYVARENWRDALALLTELGIPNGDRGVEAKDRGTDGTAGTYMDDPAGYVIQYITDGMQ